MKLIRKIGILALALALTISALTIPASAAGQTMYGIGFVNTDGLRLRSEASTNSTTLATAAQDECVVVVSQSGDWYKVIYNLQEGYMYGAYRDVLTQENAEFGYGSVTGSGVNLRSGPGTGYSSVAVASSGEQCYILGLNNGWYKVLYNSTICYIRSDYLELTEIPYENQASPNSPKFFRRGNSTGVTPSAAALNGTTAATTAAVTSTSTAASSSSGVTGAQILAEAQKYLGCPYVSGGASPSGFDCSGFVYYVLKQLGFSPYRTPASQYTQGTYVEKSDLQVGDIVFFAGTAASGISHVGIYAGNGQFIHAPNSRSTVSYSDLTSGYWANHYYGARRMS